VAAYEAAGIATHVGYIIGFPTDTDESVRHSIERLIHEVRPSTASFFMLTPLPGSMEHVKLRRRGEWMAEDLNLYDSFHETTHHPHLTDGLWTKAYREAWERFYDADNLKAMLLRTSTETAYWNSFKHLLWYKSSLVVYREHPMISGFLRFKGRTRRRPGFSLDPRRVYWPRRLRELAGETVRWWALFREFRQLWLDTRQAYLATPHALAHRRSHVRYARDTVVFIGHLLCTHSRVREAHILHHTPVAAPAACPQRPHRWPLGRALRLHSRVAR